MGLTSSEKRFSLRARDLALFSSVRSFLVIALLIPLVLSLSFSQSAFAGSSLTQTQKPQNTTVLFTDTPFSLKIAKRMEEDQDEPTIKRSRYVLVQFDLLRRPDSLFVLNLFEDVSFAAVQDRVEIRAENRYTWFGRIGGIEQSQVVLVVEDGSMAGNIIVFPDLYQIRVIGDGVHGVYEIDQSAFPPHAQPIVPNQ